MNVNMYWLVVFCCCLGVLPLAAEVNFNVSDQENIYGDNEPANLFDTLSSPNKWYNYCDGEAATLKKDNSNIYLFHSAALHTYKTWGPLTDPKAHLSNSALDGVHYEKYIKIPPRLKDSISFNHAPGVKNFAAAYLENIYDIGGNELLGFLHLEYFVGKINPRPQFCDDCPGYPAKYKIGLCYSNNLGDSWYFCGNIIGVNDKTDDTATTGNNVNMAYNIGGVPYLVIGDYIYVYFNEKNKKKELQYSAVARAKLKEVIGAARRYEVTQWKKYSNGKFDQDGITGCGTPLILGPADMNTAAAYCSYINRYLLIGRNDQGLENGAGLYVYLSENGVNWKDPVLIVADKDLPLNKNLPLDYDKNKTRKALYPFFVSLKSDASRDCRVVGQEFYIYYTSTDYPDFKFSMKRVKVKVTNSRSSLKN